MDFLTTEVTTYKTGCLVNFLPCMAIYICSRPGDLWSDSLTILPCLWSILRDWMQNTLTVWQHIVLWQRGPLSQPACCQAQSYPHKTHPVIYQCIPHISISSICMIWQFNPCKSRETLNFHTVPTVVIGMLRSDGWRFGFAFNKSFPTVYFGADVSASCLCWKDAAWDWFNIKKPSHGRK